MKYYVQPKVCKSDIFFGKQNSIPEHNIIISWSNSIQVLDFPEACSHVNRVDGQGVGVGPQATSVKEH